MNIIVCIKQVPEIGLVKVDPQEKKIIFPDSPGVLNPFDVYAVEESLRIKEKKGGKVFALSLGGPESEVCLREALSLGADEAVLLSDEKFKNLDAYLTSFVLAQGIKKIGDYYLVLFGKQAVDGDSSLIPAEVAEWLDLPQVIFVKKFEELTDNMASVRRMTEDGYDLIETSLPAVISVVKEINEPRLPSLKGKMKAKSAKITVWNSKDLQVEENRLGENQKSAQIISVSPPPPRPKGEILEGSPEEIAEKLAAKLREAQVI